LKDILEMNELDRQGAQAFTRPSSEFYPQFEAAVRAGVDGWCAEWGREDKDREWVA
jgi:hypothetical protein